MGYRDEEIQAMVTEALIVVIRRYPIVEIASAHMVTSMYG